MPRDHIFGLMATSNATFAPVQDALKSWSNAKCLSFTHGKNVTGAAFLTTPSVISTNGTNSPTGSANSTSGSSFRRWTGRLLPRADCTTHVCCSAGTLPDFAPKPNPDGSCATYTVQSNDNCAGIGAANSLTTDQLTNFNNDTWAWNGCSNLWLRDPPMPAPLANALCGPQVPGTTAPPAGTNISTLNPCPLNACCDVWGQCGITADFCTDTGTGAPGTAKPGTNGCISNCGMNIVRSGAPAVFRSIAPRLYQDALQLEASKYTHLHFAFGTLTADYQVQVGDRIEGPARILSFGGTYTIFRQGVTPANRLTMATNIANFIIANNLDGVDIDWEYPGAPDIAGIPPADPNDGMNYLAFLATLKNLIPGKSVSIAAPASYWYLKGFPIAKISKVVDYIVFMTYDLHGQWDAGSQFAQVGCPTGNCLRSDVNLTETINALVMITKAGVPSNQVVVGVTSYGRSFAMADTGCYTENCFFTGSPCTGTAGYISDAEIKAIISSGNVNQNYIDPQSNTNILVYNDTQWVGYMSPEIKASRKTIYQGLEMGGSTDWASDLEDYTDPPARASSWPNFTLSIKTGTDPYQVGPRNGNWTTITCTDPSSEMDAPDAWTDVINVWTTYDRGKDGLSFTQSISDTLHGPEQADCGSLLDTSNCVQTEQCDGFIGAGSGAAAYEIWNSFVIIHEVRVASCPAGNFVLLTENKPTADVQQTNPLQMYSSYSSALYKAAAAMIDPALKDFENKFAPTWPKAFFAYAIPAIWSVSGVFPFVIDSGYACGTVDPLGAYLSTDTMHATWGCYNDKLYYLATPSGDAESCPTGSCDGCEPVCTDNFFSAPPGLDSLDGTTFGGIPVSDLIQGAVRTYIQNGNQNGGGVADPGVSGTLDDLYNQDVTTPGPDMAFKAWDATGGPSTSTANYPCIIPPGVNDCGTSTFVDQTSSASPLVADCLQIVKNIEGTSGEWEVENALGDQHQLVQSGTCKFGVQGMGKNGNINFHVGSQDIVDIINQAVKQFGGSGQVGAEGDMTCNGDVKGQDVQWGLY
ncbi:hypothetical protein QBC46DRAFT_461157 [Diplogelasinospora grovesii]|uniref:chitinase n=1 Tax=Diplogelasinospora grovesii TaxID=303347 RepID=A0AAN6S220_9PEZI|nr:hypothetical protein QBC46DRAFT_461157 [Diplogelasinospora grovesii]